MNEVWVWLNLDTGGQKSAKQKPPASLPQTKIGTSHWVHLLYIKVTLPNGADATIVSTIPEYISFLKLKFNLPSNQVHSSQTSGHLLCNNAAQLLSIEKECQKFGYIDVYADTATLTLDMTYNTQSKDGPQANWVEKGKQKKLVPDLPAATGGSRKGGIPGPPGPGPPAPGPPGPPPPPFPPSGRGGMPQGDAPNGGTMGEKGSDAREGGQGTDSEGSPAPSSGGDGQGEPAPGPMSDSGSPSTGEGSDTGQGQGQGDGQGQGEGGTGGQGQGQGQDGKEKGGQGSGPGECEECDGSGKDLSNPTQDCEECDGTGEQPDDGLSQEELDKLVNQIQEENDSTENPPEGYNGDNIKDNQEAYEAGKQAGKDAANNQNQNQEANCEQAAQMAESHNQEAQQANAIDDLSSALESAADSCAEAGRCAACANPKSETDLENVDKSKQSATEALEAAQQALDNESNIGPSSKQPIQEDLDAAKEIIENLSAGDVDSITDEYSDMAQQDAEAAQNAATPQDAAEAAQSAVENANQCAQESNMGNPQDRENLDNTKESAQQAIDASAEQGNDTSLAQQQLDGTPDTNSVKPYEEAATDAAQAARDGDNAIDNAKESVENACECCNRCDPNNSEEAESAAHAVDEAKSALDEAASAGMDADEKQSLTEDLQEAVNDLQSRNVAIYGIWDNESLAWYMDEGGNVVTFDDPLSAVLYGKSKGLLSMNFPEPSGYDDATGEPTGIGV